MQIENNDGYIKLYIKSLDHKLFMQIVYILGQHKYNPRPGDRPERAKPMMALRTH